ncbi:MAG TPA: CdaR family protein [Bryobacteraceae bacterium]|mgnify:CR=1 FL=1|nr:CdaR family protein [Bryobacteraceae bacterium]HPU74246.1 CdaR family protein [Bryobacteraceae bacterium]
MIRALLNNLGWKLLALGIALALWLIFVGSPELLTSVIAHIQYQNVPADLEMSSEAPERIYLEVQGPATRMRNFDASRTAVVFDLSGVHRPGDYTFPVNPSNIVDLPAGMELVRAVPGQVRLHFEPRVSAEVPVRVRFSSPPPEGYHVVKEEVSPPRLTIIGPESRVRQVGYVESDSIDLSHVIGEAQFRVHAFIPDPQVRFASSSEVEVFVRLEKTAQGGVAGHEGAATVRH